jgi:hypothetical protein
MINNGREFHKYLNLWLKMIFYKNSIDYKYLWYIIASIHKAN